MNSKTQFISLHSKLLEEFKKKYPGITSGDIQTFTMGMIALEEALSKEVEIKGNLIQLMDEDDDQAGLIVTDADNSTVQNEWPKFRLDSNDAGADTFADYLIEKGFKAERVYTEKIGPRG